MIEGTQKVIRSEPYEVFIMNISTSGDFDVPIKGRRFPLMILDCADALPEGAMNRISLKMVESGCRYAVCAGKRSRDWETAFDNADIQRNPSGEADQFVMTTSHEGEALDAATFEFLFLTSTDAQADKFLIAFVNGDEEDCRRVEKSIEDVRNGDD